MIDLPMAAGSETIELNEKVLLYNRLLLVINSILLAVMLFGLFQYRSKFNATPFDRFVIAMLIIGFSVTLVDIVFGVKINNNDVAASSWVQKYFLVPVILDILLVFAVGLGIIKIFLRIVIYGALNPDTLYYDDDDPLFSS